MKIMGLHQLPYHNLWRPPYPNDTPKFHLIYMKRCVKDVNKLHRGVWRSVLVKKQKQNKKTNKKTKQNKKKRCLGGPATIPLRRTRVNWKIIVLEISLAYSNTFAGAIFNAKLHTLCSLKWCTAFSPVRYARREYDFFFTSIMAVVLQSIMYISDMYLILEWLINLIWHQFKFSTPYVRELRETIPTCLKPTS